MTIRYNHSPVGAFGPCFSFSQRDSPSPLLRTERPLVAFRHFLTYFHHELTEQVTELSTGEVCFSRPGPADSLQETPASNNGRRARARADAIKPRMHLTTGELSSRDGSPFRPTTGRPLKRDDQAIAAWPYACAKSRRPDPVEKSWTKNSSKRTGNFRKSQRQCV